jgi:hypothetical protein
MSKSIAEVPESTIRRQVLAHEVARYPTRAAFVREHGLNESYICQLLNRLAPFGERAARKLEGQIGLPRGWLDREIGA